MNHRKNLCEPQNQKTSEKQLSIQRIFADFTLKNFQYDQKQTIMKKYYKIFLVKIKKHFIFAPLKTTI